VIDYVGGFADLRKNYLRTIGQPFLRFKQDPVRMIRLIKFQARFGFDVDPEAKIALADCRLEIMKSSQARVLEEILRMLESGASAPFLKLMSETGFLEHLMPALANFLETREGSEVFSYLQEVDSRKETLHRATLLACLLFPFVQKRIKTHFLDRDKIPHLGDILQETNNAIHTIFQPFFLLPRRLKMGIGSIVTAQYRMTPIEAKHSRRIRIPRDADFPLALEFLSLRTCLEPALIETGAAWKKAYEETHFHHRRRK
jgi:poly(A) polymerase